MVDVEDSLKFFMAATLDADSMSPVCKARKSRTSLARAAFRRSKMPLLLWPWP